MSLEQKVRDGSWRFGWRSDIITCALVPAARGRAEALEPAPEEWISIHSATYSHSPGPTPTSLGFASILWVRYPDNSFTSSSPCTRWITA